MFKVIVWATDGSQSAENALTLAHGLAKSSGAKLLAVHVDELEVGRASGYHHSADEGEIEQGLRHKVEELKQEGIDAALETPKVAEGGAAKTIADLARDAGADLIVTGTRGHGPVAGVLVAASRSGSLT